MDKMDKLQQILYERLHRRPAGIDELDRLWEAAVLLPLVQTDKGIAVLFEERAHSLRRQPGEICFPGGKVECSDANFAAAAVRETCEELGLLPQSITLCGELDSLVTHTGPIIHPFVGVLDDISKITYSASEVECIFTVPVKELLAIMPKRCSMELADHPGEDFPFDLVPNRMRSWRKHKEYYVYFYEYEGRVIWGLTARILYAFLRRSGKELAAFVSSEER
mgnify:CR=1 FL=1